MIDPLSLFNFFEDFPKSSKIFINFFPQMTVLWPCNVRTHHHKNGKSYKEQNKLNKYYLKTMKGKVNVS